MNIKTIFFFIAVALSFGACKSFKKVAAPELDPSLTGNVTAPQEVIVREEKVRQVDQPENAPVYRYYVIIGSFKVAENARQFIADMDGEGFTPVILENENGLFRVSAGAGNDERAARNLIAEIRAASDKYSDVWLLVRK